jgi:hypothetical protein
LPGSNIYVGIHSSHIDTAIEKYNIFNIGRYIGKIRKALVVKKTLFPKMDENGDHNIDPRSVAGTAIRLNAARQRRQTGTKSPSVTPSSTSPSTLSRYILALVNYVTRVGGLSLACKGMYIGFITL